eukprot:11174359-Lingulodinium_polyedra.AAC.1
MATGAVGWFASSFFVDSYKFLSTFDGYECSRVVRISVRTRVYITILLLLMTITHLGAQWVATCAVGRFA